MAQWCSQCLLKSLAWYIISLEVTVCLTTYAVFFPTSVLYIEHRCTLPLGYNPSHFYFLIWHMISLNYMWFKLEILLPQSRMWRLLIILVYLKMINGKYILRKIYTVLIWFFGKWVFGLSFYFSLSYSPKFAKTWLSLEEKWCYCYFLCMRISRTGDGQQGKGESKG